MTRNDGNFQRALLASFVVHIVFVAALLLMPAGAPHSPVSIYTVHIMEVPARPQARALDLSTEAISALKPEMPSLTPEAPPSAPLQAPDLTPPQAPASEVRPSVAPPTGPPSRVEAGAPPLPEAQVSPGAPTLPPVGGSAPPGPKLPAPPAAQPAVPAPSVAARAPSPGAPAAPPPPSAPALGSQQEAPQADRLMEKLRQRVKAVELEVNASKSAPAAAPSGGVSAPSSEDRSLLALNIFRNRVWEAVKKYYTFPGGFAPDLKTRIRLVLNRDGTAQNVKILESSGNPRFDNLVCLAAVHQAVKNHKIPPIPSDIQSDTLTFNITCAP